MHTEELAYNDGDTQWPGLFSPSRWRRRANARDYGGACL